MIKLRLQLCNRENVTNIILVVIIIIFLLPILVVIAREAAQCLSMIEPNEG